MDLSDILLFNIQILFILLSIVAISDYFRHRNPQRRDFALLATALGFPLCITFLRRFFPIQSNLLNLLGAFALFAQPYFLFRLLQYFRPSRRRVSVLILIGFVASCLLIQFGLPINRILTVTTIFTYCTIAEAYATWGFYQGMQSTGGTLRRRLQIITISSGVFTFAFLINAIKAFFPVLVPAITPYAQVAAAISAILFYLSFVPPRWLQRAWQMEELRTYLSQSRVTSTNSSTVVENFQLLSQSAKQATNGLASAVLKLNESTNHWGIVAPTSQDFFAQTLQIAPPFIKQTWDQRQATYKFISDIADTKEQDQLKILGARTWLLVPIQSQDHLWGLLVVALKDRSLFVDDDLHTLELFAQECALVLNNHRLIEELQDYSGQLERKVDERTAALQRSNEELRHYAYVASHDLQEPLRMVTSYLELIELRFPDKLDAEGREFIAFAVEGAQRMKHLINDLLMYSRLETRSRTFKWIDVEAVLNKTIQMLNVTIAENDASIKHDPLPQIFGDEELMLQIFQNLIGNAIKYRSKNRPEIYISATSKDQQWIFSVQDNGIGMDNQFLERIFIIFQRLHTREKYPGTGIGLAICKKAVELHNGRIWAESQLGQGTTFHFTIPVRESNDLLMSKVS